MKVTGTDKKEKLKDWLQQLDKNGYINLITDISKDAPLNYIRNFKFTLPRTDDENIYTIRWYKNISTLYINKDSNENGTYSFEQAIRFTRIELSNTWPVHIKSEFQLFFNNEPISIIKVEDYEV